jgi:hypothetical protein
MAEEPTRGSDRIDCVLIAGGKYHDIDYARLELLKLLAETSACGCACSRITRISTRSVRPT